MELNSFRIIAVRVFSYCDPAIMRALYPETTYFLNNDYEDEYLANARNLVYSLPFTVYGISKEELDKMSDQEVAVWYNDNVIYPDKVRLNCYYYRHYSFVKDIQMILCTVLGKKMKYAGETI